VIASISEAISHFKIPYIDVGLKQKSTIRLLGFIICFLCLTGCGEESASSLAQAAKPSAQGQKSNPAAFSAKGVHVSAWVSGTDWWFKDLVALTKRTELNALVIDCKDESGYVSWNSGVKLARESGACSDIRIKDIKYLLEICKKNNVYPITRIVVFNDSVLARYKPRLAIQTRDGKAWKARKGYSYLDPYNKQAWDYNVALAQEAAALGFKEIQFDYVRFPSDGDVKSCVFPSKDNRSKSQVISGFLSYAREALKPYKVVLSVDIFGQTGLANDDMGIGQVIEDIAKNVDYICPMVYPSHYWGGVYGVKTPEKSPYPIVKASLADMKRRIAGYNCKIRPWLQDFSLKVPYGKKEVQLQIQACRDSGINEWLLWDPKCTYTEEALSRE
ncbi:MAG: putative glycoside hydrolase, partial [Candidatus Omnitrophica bacterium]|nr:putative glycoside hydrolase [Candidatus Omnitrophota bacterium]